MRTALLQNFVAPYRVPLYERLRDCGMTLRVFVSTPMESDRDWKVDWGSLDVVVQKNVTIKRAQPDARGFKRTIQIHIPYDTLPQLWRYKPDVIITVELGMRTLQAALYKILRPSTRLLIWCKLSEHSELGWGRTRLALRRFLLKRADAVMVNGESGARYIASFGVPDEIIHRVNQPVELSIFSQAARQRKDTDRTRLLCCGMLTSRKGCLPFLQELDSWARRHPQEALELWWLGNGDMRGTLEQFDCAPNLQQRFIGSVPYADLPNYYSQTDILAFPTLLDEWGLVVNEAMASGMPVLGSIYAQAVTELVTDGETGWTFDPYKSESVQQALDRVYSTPSEQLVAMRQKARSRIAGLSPAATAAKMYRAMLSPPVTRAAANWSGQTSTTR